MDGNIGGSAPEVLLFGRHFSLMDFLLRGPQAAAKGQQDQPHSFFSQTPEEYLLMGLPVVARSDLEAAAAVHFRGGDSRGGMYAGEPSGPRAEAGNAAAASTAATQSMPKKWTGIPRLADPEAVPPSRRPSSLDAAAGGNAFEMVLATRGDVGVLLPDGTADGYGGNLARRRKPGHAQGPPRPPAGADRRRGGR